MKRVGEKMILDICGCESRKGRRDPALELLEVLLPYQGEFMRFGLPTGFINTICFYHELIHLPARRFLLEMPSSAPAGRGILIDHGCGFDWVIASVTTFLFWGVTTGVGNPGKGIRQLGNNVTARGTQKILGR